MTHQRCVLTQSTFPCNEELSDFIEKEISTIPGILRTKTFVNLDVIKGAWLGVDTTQLISDLDSFLHRQKQTRQ